MIAANCPDAEAELIIEEIRSAFRHVPRGSLSLHQAMMKTWTDDERVTEAGALDLDDQWDQIPDTYIENGAKALYGADPESWRYFIPAFMIWTLRNVRQNAAFTSDQTIYTFDPCRDSSGFRVANLERYQILTQVQSRAVSQFLRFMSVHENYADCRIAQKSLDVYWGQFLNR